MLADALSIEQLRLLTSDPAKASDAVLSVLATLKSDDEETRAWASDVLETIDSLDRTTADELARLTQHTCITIASWSCRLLPLCAKHMDVQPSLIAALESSRDVGIRQQAALSLGKLTDLSDRSRVALDGATRAEDPRLSRIAKQILGQSNAA